MRVAGERTLRGTLSVTSKYATDRVDSGGGASQWAERHGRGRSTHRIVVEYAPPAGRQGSLNGASIQSHPRASGGLVVAARYLIPVRRTDAYAGMIRRTSSTGV